MRACRFQQWPDDALEAVAARYLKAAEGLPASQHALLTGLCKDIHMGMAGMSARFKREAGRVNYVTPTSYLELLKAFTALLGTKRSAVLAVQQRYEVGLEKLAFTAGSVGSMRVELTALQPVLTKTVGEVEALLVQVQSEKTNVVEPKKAAVDVEVKQVGRAAVEEVLGVARGWRTIKNCYFVLLERSLYSFC